MVSGFFAVQEGLHAMKTPGGIPILGLGTYSRTGEKGLRDMLRAIEIGYRHIDTAQTYDTEANVGEAVRRSGVSREDFFITTKVANFNLSKALFRPSVEKSLDTIRLGPVDLLLIHWPSHKDEVPFEHYIEALAEVQQAGRTRLIGVSNFTIDHLDRAVAVLGQGNIATNQVEIHPYLQAPKLCAHAKMLDIAQTAYQPLAQGRVGSDPVLQRIAGNHGVTASAISLAFLMAEGHIVIPASSSEKHLRENMQAIDVRLSDAERSEIRGLERQFRIINPSIAPVWDD
jgi:2,5-diketo-D-gluconate reductase B